MLCRPILLDASRAAWLARRAASDTANAVLFSTRGKLGVMELNRPEQLNALSLQMIDRLAAQRLLWEKDDDIACILVKGAGKAFCAGGDVVELTTSTKPCYFANFLRHEYRNVFGVSRCSKPYVSLLDGYTMGGGCGISIPGMYRVATERTVFAMPETAIGMVPDVGAGSYLHNLPGQLGVYLGATGNRLIGADVYHSGLATHYINSSRAVELEDQLAQVTDGKQVEAVLSDHHEIPSQPFSLSPHLRLIDTVFSHTTVPDILAALDADSTEWSAEQAAKLRELSPLSVAVTIRHLREGGSLSEVLIREFRICCATQDFGDFREGVRALLVEKDNSPAWRYTEYSEVSEEIIKSFFARRDELADLELNQPFIEAKL